MARKTFIELIDDINGEKADETVTFALDGVSYEIDLTTENAQKLRSELGAWTEQARRVAGRKTRGTAAKSGGDSDTPKIRQWAQDNGIQVSDRGRISQSVREQYYAAH